jgi:putative transposase
LGKTRKPKLCDVNDVVSEAKLTMCLTAKVVLHSKYTPMLDELLDKASVCISRMLQNRDERSSKYYPEIPCVVAKSLIVKYQRNRKLKKISRVVLPISGDKGRQIKQVEGGLRVPALFKKDVIPAWLPENVLRVRGVELFKRRKVWWMSYTYEVPTQPIYSPQSFLGVDRNVRQNVVVVADVATGKVRKFGPDVGKITENFRNRRRDLQKAGAKGLLVKLNRKQSCKVRDINHKVSRSVVDYAKSHCSAIVLEDLGKISKKGKARRYVQKSQWAFFQLETFIKYKAALLGIPVLSVSAAFTSQECSRCGSINKPTGKHYKCSCGHFAHRDQNAAFNISKRGEQAMIHNAIIAGSIGSPRTGFRRTAESQNPRAVLA